MCKIVCICIFFLLSSCATINKNYYTVNIDSSSELVIDKKNYWLEPGDKNQNPNDLEFKEFSSYVKKALNKNDFTEAENKEKANTIIYLYYVIGFPDKHNYTYLYEDYYRVNIKTESFYTYNKYIILSAYDLDIYRNKKQEVQLWTTKVSNSNTDYDLRLAFPLLVESVTPYIATDTTNILKVLLAEESYIDICDKNNKCIKNKTIKSGNIELFVSHYNLKPPLTIRTKRTIINEYGLKTKTEQNIKIK